MPVNYEQMVKYVESAIKPLEDHMSSHDKWHLQNLQASKALLISNGLIIVGIVVDILMHSK